MNTRRTVVIDAFPESAFRHRECDAVACIDVMLTTTTLVTAAAQGRRALVAASGQEVRELAAGLSDALLAGSLEDGPPVGFEVPDSPSALVRLAGDGRPLVLRSPPGTELIANAAGGGTVLLACFRNLSATASALAHHRRIALLAAGCREELSCEDQMAAAWIAERLLNTGFEAADRRTVDMVRRWTGIAPSLAGWGNSAANLRQAGRGEDVDFVIAHVDDIERACLCEGNEVRLEAIPVGAQVERQGWGR
jgi:phosphosulfolactate phosphohydrolase-like enzyme